MYNGVLLCDKPAGFTSHDLCAKLKGCLRIKRIGHAGTLDPMATGLMTVLLGESTVLAQFLEAERKTYEAELLLGVQTDTQDVTGTVLCRSDGIPGDEKVIEAIDSFVGPQLQVPPMYSALKTGGQTLYRLARAGKTVERRPRSIEIFSIGAEKADNDLWRLKIECSKGTYIRTLCNDIGQKLGCGGTMAALRRTAVGDMKIENAVTIEQAQALHQRGELPVIPPDRALGSLPRVVVDGEGERRCANGAVVFKSMLLSPLPDEGFARVYSEDGRFLMIGRAGELDKGGRALFCHRNFGGDHG